MNANIRIVTVSGSFSDRPRPQSQQARIMFNPPNDERVLVVYWRGSKQGFYDATVEDIAPNNYLAHRYPVRNDYINGLLTPLSTDKPLPKEWLDEHREQLEIITYRGAKCLDNLQYTLRW